MLFSTNTYATNQYLSGPFQLIIWPTLFQNLLKTELKIIIRHTQQCHLCYTLNTNEYLNTTDGISVRLYFTTSISEAYSENYKLLTDKQQRSFSFLQKAELNFSLTVIINTILVSHYTYLFSKYPLNWVWTSLLCYLWPLIISKNQV